MEQGGGGREQITFPLGAPSSHDKRKRISPSYSFGVRHKEFTNNHSPGPKFNIEGNHYSLSEF